MAALPRLVSSLSLGGLLKEQAEASLAEYIRQAWHVVEPKTTYAHNWHIDLIAEHLEAVTLGQITRLMINEPPRHMKSLEVSVMWPTWEWGPRAMPWLRYLFGSYSAALSLKHSDDRRTIIRSPYYRDRWGNRVIITKDLESEFRTSERGHMIASSTGGSATGRGGSRVIIDDFTDPEQAYSKKERENANRIYDQKFSNRLDDPRKDPIIVIQHRLHEVDTCGHIIGELKEKGWTVIRLEAECEERVTFTFPRSGIKLMRRPGKHSLIRKPGQKTRQIRDGGLLYPGRFPRRAIDDAKSKGSYYFSAQFQQRPAPLGGGLWKRAWFKYYRALPTINRLIIAADTANKEGQENDYSVLQVWGETQMGYFLINQFRERVAFPELKRLAFWFNLQYRPVGFLVEDKSSGTPLVQEMRRPLMSDTGAEIKAPAVPVIPVPAEIDKVARFVSVTPLGEAGLVWLPADAPWLEDFIGELTQFPNAAHDDQVDTVAHALRYLRGTGSMIEYYRRQVENMSPQSEIVAGDPSPAVPESHKELMLRPPAPKPISSRTLDAYNTRMQQILAERAKGGA